MSVSRTAVAGLIALVAVLMACASGGGGKDCSAQPTREGKLATGTGGDRLEARHVACRAWCTQNDPSSSDAFLLAGCASRCGGDVQFGVATATVSCK